MSQIDLSVIVVSWNVRELLRNCLAAVAVERSHLALELIVVDNASADGSAEMVAAEFPWVTLIRSDENVGFPRGNNIGIAAAHGRYLLLLNPDTVTHEKALLKMVQYLDAHPDVGVVGAQLLNEDGSVQSSRRRFPTLLTGFVESTWWQPWAPTAVLAHYYMDDCPVDQTHDVDWLMGACLMTRQPIVQQVGGLDEGYFMYSEELDWCRRIKEAGWRIVYLPTARVTHLQGKSSDQVVAQRHIYFNRAKLRYYRKYHGRGSATLLRLFLLLNYVCQIGVELVKGVVGHKRPLRWQRIKAYWLVLRSGLSPAGY